MKRRTKTPQLFLGENVGTGSTNATLISATEILWEGKVPHAGQVAEAYGLKEGFFALAPGDFYLPPLLLVEAHEQLLEKLKKEVGTETIGNIHGMRTAAQQHGTWWGTIEADCVLGDLRPDLPLVNQVTGMFALPFSPMWMNSATGQECYEMTEKKPLDWWAKNSGSVPTRRFPLAQTKRLSKMYPGNWKLTTHVGLLNSLISSIDAGALMPWDVGEALASNLGSILMRKWLKTAIRCVPGLDQKLPDMVETDYYEFVADWIRHRFGFDQKCRVYVGGGDNNWSIIGSGVTEPGQEVWSFGTSFTRLSILDGVPTNPDPTAHIMAAGNGRLMKMHCMSNGGRCFQHQCDLLSISLQKFDELVAIAALATGVPPMVPFLVTESVPVMEPRWKYSGGMEPDDSNAPLAVVQALIGNMLLAGSNNDVKEIVATGSGASDAVCQVLADMSGATVRKGPKDTVSLGAAIGAAHYTTGIEWSELTKALCKTTGEFHPYGNRHQYYKDEYLPALRKLIYGV